MYYDQAQFDLRCEWGLPGLRAVQASIDAVVIVDVLSFSTAVDVAVSRGASVYPYRYRDESAREFAASMGALLAGPRRLDAFSLSPVSLRRIPEGAALVLPSPNGSDLSFHATGIPTFTACLRNAAQVAKCAASRGRRIAVIPAGERWEDGSNRPCVEDLIGAGAVLANLPGTRSPEAEVAVAAFTAVQPRLFDVIWRCSSGRELVEAGFAEDVELACEYGTSSVVPVLVGRAFTNDLQS